MYLLLCLNAAMREKQVTFSLVIEKLLCETFIINTVVDQNVEMFKVIHVKDTNRYSFASLHFLHPLPRIFCFTSN